MLFALFGWLNAQAQNFSDNGINYSVTSQNTVSVRYQNASVTGVVILPAQVTYNSSVYSVTSIEADAFSNCINLTEITIPNSVISIGGFAFNSCYNLTSVTIPNSVTSIGNNTFQNCSSLTSVTIPNSVTSIADSTFNGCLGLISVTIPTSVTSIGNSAFNYCSALLSVTIPNSVISIGNYAFYNCAVLMSVTIPNSVTSIGHNAFGYCTGLTSVNIPDSVTSIGDYTFNSCYSLASVSIPNSITSIGVGTFSDCYGLTSVSIPNSVTSIGAYAFGYCNNLTAVTIPNSVTSIGDYAFYACSSLTSITIPSSVTSIADYAFNGCSSLTSVICNITAPLSINANVFGYVNQGACSLLVPNTSVGAYQNAPVWQNFNPISELVLIVPTFETVASICSGQELSALPTTSTNGITGTWSPALNNLGTTIYTFTPNAGQGASTTTLEIVVNQTAVAVVQNQSFCEGATVANLVASGTDLQWYAAPTGGTALEVTTALSSGTYYVTQILDGCESEKAAFNVIINTNQIVGSITGDSSICIDATTTLTGPAMPTGGTITTSGGYRVHTFTSNGTFTIPVGFTGAVEVLVVAGGGGGGANGGGGGGAGGVISSPSVSLSGTTTNVIVGNGGIGSSTGTLTGGNGNNSLFGNLTAFGGGGGSGRDGGGSALSGGSGGGGSGAQLSNPSGAFAGSGIGGQGNNGGNGTFADVGCDAAGGGGGGAGSVGFQGASFVGGNGGSGIASSISGINRFYAAGGGGGRTCTNSTFGIGGNNIGGNGGGNVTIATNGQANTGAGGGGGGGQIVQSISGGNGGSGIVIVRYKDYSTNIWVSSNPAVATVNASGVVTGVSAGSATISQTTSTCFAPTPFNITVQPINTVATANPFPTFCVNNTNFGIVIHTTTGVTGIGNATGLPIGMTVSYINNSITISGVATVAGTYNYTIPLTAGCGPTSATGTIIINPMTPTFTQVADLCAGAPLDPLPTTSTNGITGTWTPALNNLATTTYTFTPNAVLWCVYPVTMTINVNTTPAPTADAQTFCNNAMVANLAASGTTLQWYDTEEDGIALAGTTALVSGNYFVSQTLNGCESLRTMVVVTVNVTDMPTATAQTFCYAATVADLVATGSDLKWYEGFSIVPLTTSAVLATGDYYVSQTLNGCASPKTLVAVTVNATQAPNAPLAQTFCNSATVANLVAFGINLKWYDTLTGGTALEGTTNLTTGNYFVSTTLNDCESPRTMIVVTVNVTPAPAAIAQTFCISATVANLVAFGLDLQWYSSPNSLAALPETTTLITGNYFVSQTINGCESPRFMIMVTVNVTNMPSQPAVAQIFCSTATVANLEASGTNLQWYSSPNSLAALPPTNPLITGNYFVSQTVNGCESPRAMVGITIIALPTVIITNPAPIDFPATADLTAAAVTAGSSPELTFTYFTDAAATTAVANPTTVGIGTYYIVGTNDAGCSSNAVPVNVRNSSTIYVDGAWSDGFPDSTINAVIQDNFIMNANLSAFNLTVNQGYTITVASGTTLTVENGIINNAGVTGIVVENNGVLLQTATSPNDSDLVLATVKCNSSNLYRQDYTLWSSPVSGQNLRAFSNMTLFNRFYSYDPALGTIGDYAQEIFTTGDLNTKLFTNSKGYLIRMPNDWAEFVDSSIAGLQYNGIFKGTLNNGTISIPLSTANIGFNLVGNPYPSPISISAFFTENSGIQQTLYFWRKRNGAAGSGYATTNSLGLVSAQVSVNGLDMQNTIKPGQGFFVKSEGATALTFTNSMRTNTTSTPFLRTATSTELHRFWLNLSTATGVVGQTLIGYSTGASQGFDDGLDAPYFNDSALALTSLIDGNEHIIQGRSVPFVTSDVVPLGFKSDMANNFTISLSNFDGLFAGNQDIFLKDKVTGALQNLKLGDYSFTSGIGLYNNRFEVQFMNTLGTDEPGTLSNKIVVAVKDQVIKINAADVMIKKVDLVDVTGRVIYSQDNINATTTTIEDVLATNQMLIVRITTQNQGVLNQKIIY